MTADDRTTTPAPRPGHLPVRLRGPADMAEMLPYLLGFFPDDSIVAVGLQGAALDQGGVIRIDIPEDPADWERTAVESARLLVELSEQRDRRPVQVLLYLCRDPAGGPGGPEGAHAVLARLRPLAAALARAFRDERVAVKESLCVSGGRWWSFLCAGADCCPPDGTPVRAAHQPSPLAAAATYAGLAPRGSRKAIVAGLSPIGPPGSETQRRALEDAGPPFIRELAGPGGREAAVERTAELLAEAMAEFHAGAKELDAARTARLLIGLQDKLGRDRAAEYAEPDELAAAQRLWRFLIQRCVDPFEHLASPPLTLLAWTSWLADDSATARVVLARALELEPTYTLAQLLYESLNAGLAPEALLRVVRRERTTRLRDPQVSPQSPQASQDQGTPQAPPPSEPPPPAPGAGPEHPGPTVDPGPAVVRPAEGRATAPGERSVGFEAHRAPEPDGPGPAPAADRSAAPEGGRPTAAPDGPPAAACRAERVRRSCAHRITPASTRVRPARTHRNRHAIGD
ncbi:MULTISPECIES: DUF4192 domain-containing protein [Kitasatospora]|uniref:DUF4192 domain-containing protein n=1 Tax=Kitasatospora setae (strain ATCC 33774 / DSM 43861 / JCM 3304 / KCC A-0304 / NBRC 14216 / KM-6054) TaxID=452652 RepID=E4NI44_KITSK|nr:MULTISPECIES: DUF4192 domain-containing protein [Kitasatospora]BAJ31174.1 hypothetical protein KSE_53990 [Kitasatospora setae KM-6054]